MPYVTRFAERQGLVETQHKKGGKNEAYCSFLLPSCGRTVCGHRSAFWLAADGSL